ncbi:MAG: HAMP domain-containing histidine kinase [Campylobacterales bacterium]|nr:HAMP domain-containing histidine kinase [Campylobacterales bacterium]
MHISEIELALIILVIVVFTIFMIIYIKNTISKPFDYLIRQMENKDDVDIAQLHGNFEYEKISYLYDGLRKMQQEIEAKNKQLKSDNKDFILSSVHQLKTPLSAIVMNLELLEMSGVYENSKEFIEQIKSSVDMLDLNFEELVYLSLRDDVEYKVKQTDISELLRQRVEFFKQIASSNDKELVLDIDDALEVQINSVEFERLVDNNISNAIKYADVGTKVKIYLKADGDKFLLKFESTGKEIKEPLKLFEKGYRESKKNDGYGLGLYIIKTICDKYDIKIEIVSKNGKNIFSYTIKS